MKNRNLEHSDNWKTPDYVYIPLNAEFDFDFDPCPLNHDLTKWDGLLLDWSLNNYIGFDIWKTNSNVQNVGKLNRVQNLVHDLIEDEVFALNVNNVCQIQVVKEVDLKERQELESQKDLSWYQMDCSDVQNVLLLNHLIRLILVVTPGQKQDIALIANAVKESIPENVFRENEQIQKQKILLRLKNINTDILLGESRDIEKDLQSEIINIEQELLNGVILTGNFAKNILQINVPIVDQKTILLKIIFSLYSIMILLEQSPETSSPLVENAIVLKDIKTLMNGLHKKLLPESKSISQVWMKFEKKCNSFVNPPYSRKLKEAFIKKAYLESKRGKLCVMLLPVSTSTQIFHDYIYGKAEIRFLKGRVKFEGVNTKGETVNNKCGMHDSMIVIFDGREK